MLTAILLTLITLFLFLIAANNLTEKRDALAANFLAGKMDAIERDLSELKAAIERMENGRLE